MEIPEFRHRAVEALAHDREEKVRVDHRLDPWQASDAVGGSEDGTAITNETRREGSILLQVRLISNVDMSVM